jgi:hypothetical protein
MEKRDLFNALGMGTYIWGDAFLYSLSPNDLATPDTHLSILDAICEAQNWTPIGKSWKPYRFSECAELLMDAIEFDIAYSTSRITPPEVALTFHQALIKDFSEETTHCYSNWMNNHWRSKAQGSSWRSLTENTFDLSTVFIKPDRILITCFRSED